MSNTIENYELLEEIGSGGFGVVYRAIHRKSLQPFAVKTSQFSDRSLIRESKTLKHLSNNILKHPIKTLNQNSLNP